MIEKRKLGLLAEWIVKSHAKAGAQPSAAPDNFLIGYFGVDTNTTRSRARLRSNRSHWQPPGYAEFRHMCRTKKSSGCPVLRNG